MRRWKDSPFKPPEAIRFAKYSSTSAPVVISTVDVSEYGLPVDCVSIVASSCVRDLIIEAAFKRIRDRSIGGVDDQAGKALELDSTAASSAMLEDV